jgi:hypothetical protein
MGLGGLPSIGGQGPNIGPGNQGASQNKGGTEFSLEQQKSNLAQAQAAQDKANSALSGAKLMKIIDKKKKNRKGAPRTMLIDGEIYEVYLLAIA